MKLGRMLMIVGAILGVFVVGVVALFLVQNFREESRRTQSSNKLKLLSLAMHNHHDTHKTYPGQGTGANWKGKSLLSWRVHLLPFIDQQSLYERFHLDEPWDSEHNFKLIDSMPSAFRSPGSLHSNKTSYLAPILPGSPFASQGAFNQASIVDLQSRTIMFVEAVDEKAVIWTKPEDLEIDPENPTAGITGSSKGGFLVVMFDGSVRFIEQSIDSKSLRAMYTSQGLD